MLSDLLGSGVRRVRFTGGEPLLSPHVLPLIEHAVACGAEDIALTTNGTRLRELAWSLRKAGLRRLTVSLDTLEPERFSTLTRGGRLPIVLDGLDAALDVGFEEIKLNTVVLRGQNDHELESITRFAWARGIVPRFIELMTIGAGASLPSERHFSAAEIWQRLAPLVCEASPEFEPDRGPARYLTSREDPRLRLGVISGHTDTYCESCDRLRVSSAGHVRACLARPDFVDVRPALQLDTPEAVLAAIEHAWSQKPDGRTFRGCTEPSAAEISMRAIGG